MALDFLLGLFFSLLPARLRQQRLTAWQGNLRVCALVSGIVQFLGLLGLQIARYFFFMNYRLGTIAEALHQKDAATAVGSTGVQFGMGFVSLLEFLVQPLTLLLIYFMLEGFIRAAAALITGEVLGTLPLLLWERAAIAIANRTEEKRQGALIPDLVTPAPVEGSGYELAVASCRAKPNWDHLMTISYNEMLYEIADYIEAAPPRRHVYLLRRVPQSKVIRGLHHYEPEELLKN